MTLVIYKNGTIAADTRTSINCSHREGSQCAHCGKDTESVRDTSQKIKLGFGKKFRGETIIAMGSSGNTEMIARVRNIMRHNLDIEEVYKHYQILHGTQQTNPLRCTFMFICETNNYTVSIPEKGELLVKQHPKDKPLFIGSGQTAARTFDDVTNASACILINLVMAKETSVGGEIDYIDTKAEQVAVKRHVKTPPADMLHVTQQIYLKGFMSMQEPAKTTPPKSKPGRKAKTPEEKAAALAAKPPKPAAKKAPAKKQPVQAPLPGTEGGGQPTIE